MTDTATPRNELDAGLREARYAAEQAHKLLAKGIKQRRWNDIGLARQHVKAIRAALAAPAALAHERQQGREEAVREAGERFVTLTHLRQRDEPEDTFSLTEVMDILDAIASPSEEPDPKYRNDPDVY